MESTATVPVKQGDVATVDLEILTPPMKGEYTLVLLDAADPAENKRVLVSFPLTVKPKND